MTLIYPAKLEDIVDNEPRLHALVIGVSSYPHLNDGTGPAAQDALGLGQLSTPRYTALAVADWLIKHYQQSAKPLGSVELLYSADNKNNGPAADEATCANIIQAFNRWVQRCSKHPDNLAFFYFCGHGLHKDEQFLLPEDFGDPGVANRWQNAINFDATRVGMRACKAQTQIFFVDACRDTPFGMLDQLNVSGQILVSASVSDPVKKTAAFYATSVGEQAFGPSDDVTYFGQAVIQCLNGLAAVNSMGKWTVNTWSLSKSLGEVMDHFAEKFGRQLDCNSDVSGLGVIHEPACAKVIAQIGCTSLAATRQAEIELRRNGTSHKAALTDAKPLIQEVEPGEWEVVVTFPMNDYPNQAPVRCVLIPAVFHGVNVP
jgi:hypothetical protein